jgi:hypothetical protein
VSKEEILQKIIDAILAGDTPAVEAECPTSNVQMLMTIDQSSV